MKNFKLVIYTGIALAALAASAHGQTAVNDNQVVLDWGNMLASAALFVGSLAAAVVSALFRHLPGNLAATAKIARIDQLLENAINYGCNVVAGATRDKQLTFDVANDVLESALEYAVKQGPSKIIDWAGGEDGLRAKIIARLDVTPETALAPA